MQITEQLTLLKRGIIEIFTEAELAEKLTMPQKTSAASYQTRP